MNKVMKIKKGVERTDEGVRNIPAYVSKCQASLMIMLNESDTDAVTIKAVGNAAIGNTMKTIARTAKQLENEGKTLKLNVPVFVMEENEDGNIAVFNIDVSVQ